MVDQQFAKQQTVTPFGLEKTIDNALVTSTNKIEKT
jgi:hypothetical protein